MSSTLASTSAVHSNGATRLFAPVAQTADFASASQAAPSVVPAVVRPSSTARAQPTHQTETDPASAAADTAASAAAAGSVAELRRTEQQLDVGFRAAQDLEWQKRDAEIGRQAEEARRLKRQRKAANEKAAKQQVMHLTFSTYLHRSHHPCIPCGTTSTALQLLPLAGQYSCCMWYLSMADSDPSAVFGIVLMLHKSASSQRLGWGALR